MSSEFLQLLITQTWQIAALTIVVAIVSRLAAKNRPHLAHALWMLVLIKCVTPPLWGHSLGVFSQLQATFAPDESTATDIEPGTDTMMLDAPDIALSVPNIETTSAEDRSLEFFEHDERDAALEFEAQSEVGSFGYNDTASAYDETPAAIAAVAVEPSELTVNDAHFKSLLIAAIFTGAILTLLIMIFRCFGCLRLIHRERTTEFDETLRNRIQQLSKQLCIRRAPQIIVSNVLFGPAVLGFLRHTIVLPRCLFESIEGPNSDAVPSPLGTGERVADRPDEGSGREPSAVDAQLHFLDPILAHELLHIRRGDLRTGTLQAIVASLWWFHPAVWFSNRWLSREAERCCDEQVIAELGCTPGQYARALLSVIECKHRLQPIPVFPGMKPVEITTLRMERIMSLRNGLKKRTPLWCWLMIVALAFVVLPGAVAQPRDDENSPVAAPPVEEPESEQTIEDARSVSKHAAQVTQRTFEGNRFWGDGDLRKQLVSKQNVLIFGAIYNPDTIPADIEVLKSYYRSVGFFDVEVTGKPLFSKDRSEVNLHFTVTEGSRYKVRKIRYEGNKRISVCDLEQDSNLQSGDMYSSYVISTDLQRIHELYKELRLEPAINPVPHFLEERGICDLVFEIDEELKGLIRLDESFIPSPALVLTADTVLAFVGEKAIVVSDVVNKLPETLNEDPYLTKEAQRRILMARVLDGLPLYLYNEVVICDFEKHVPKERREAMIASYKSPLEDLLEKMSRDRKLTNVEEELEATGNLTEEMRESFRRRQIVVGYTKSLGIDSPVLKKDSIQQYCRQLVFEARLRARVSLSFEESELNAAVQFLEETYQIRFAGNDLAPPVTVTVQLKDVMLLDAIKAIVEPHGFQVAVGPEEVVLTAKPLDQLIIKTQESASLRVPALPLPKWIRKSASGPLVKLAWDARNASRRRLLMTDQRTPWQFMNGLAALRRDFLVREGDETVAGLDWLQDCKSFPGQPWFEKTEFGGQPNPKPAPFWFDDHAEQFVATLAMNDVPLATKFATADGTITMGDMIKHLQMTVSGEKLTPWTLIALSKYLPRNEKWTNANGEQWNVERLVGIELDKPNDMATSLMSLAVARNHYFQDGEALDGIWLQADQRIVAAIGKSRPSQTNDGKIITTYDPNIRRPHFQYRSESSPRTPTPGTAPTYIDPFQMEMDANLRIRQAAFTYDTALTNRAQRLLFLTIALPDDQLREDWFRLEIETTANDLVADWSNKEIRSPFYETTQALTIYLERFAKYLARADAAGLSPVLAGDVPVRVFIKGMVREPVTAYQSPAGVRVLDAIARVGGPQDETADTVSVRRSGNQTRPSIVRLNIERAKRGADPNIFLMPGDEVLVHPAELVKAPLANSIRLDDNFVLSPDSPFNGNTVILFLNDKPITVAKIMGSGWERLERTPGVTELLKRRIALESIASGLPEFVYQELVLQYFNAEIPKLDQEVSPQQREVTDKKFVEALEKLPETHTDRRTQAQFLGVILAYESASNTALRQKQVDAYVRGLQSSTVASNKSSVIKHVEELVTTARLRSAESLDYTNTTLAEVIRSQEQVYGVKIKVNALHDQISQRISDRPAAVDFHSENKSLADSLTAIFELFGLALHLEGDDVLLQFADSKQAMEKFRTLPGPPSFGVFGVLRKPGWHPLKKEIRLLDALAIAGGVENADGVSIEITNPDILSGKANPVSMSLQVLQSDTSGKLNRIVQDGDMITVIRNGWAEAPLVKNSGAPMINGNGVKRVIKLKVTGLIVESPDAQKKSAEPLHKGNLSTLVPAYYDSGSSQKGLGPGRAPQEEFLTPDRPMPPAVQQSSDPLVKQVWQMRESIRKRLLSTDQYTPWQLMQGLNGLRRDWFVQHDGNVVNGLKWIQTGPMFEGEPWFQKTVRGGQAHPYTKPYAFQGHINQFAATLAMCDVPLDAQFGTPDGPITIADLVKHAQMTANDKEEVSWTLQLLCKYLPVDAEWVNAKGEKWSIERLVKTAIVKATPSGSPEGGTFGLFALAVARNEYLRTGKPLNGVWLDADKTIQKHIQLVHEQQNSNGTLSSNYFRGRQENKDFDKHLASSGALLEFLVMAVSDEQLKEDWVRQAVAATVKDFEDHRKSFVSCSPLFRATNALSIYLDRVLDAGNIVGLKSLEAYHEIGVTPLIGSSVVATVNGKPVFVDDILGSVRRKIDADPNLSDEQRQLILLQMLRARTREYAEDELVVQALETEIPEDKRQLIHDSLEPAFQEVCQKMMKDQKFTTDEELDQWLEGQGFTRREMKDTFIRRQFVVGYVQSKLQVPAQIDRAVLVNYYQEHIDEYTRVEVSQVINAPHPTTVEFEAVQEEIQNKLLGQLREDAQKQVLAEICAKGHVITIFDGEEPAE